MCKCGKRILRNMPNLARQGIIWRLRYWLAPDCCLLNITRWISHHTISKIFLVPPTEGFDWTHSFSDADVWCAHLSEFANGMLVVIRIRGNKNGVKTWRTASIEMPLRQMFLHKRPSHALIFASTCNFVSYFLRITCSNKHCLLLSARPVRAQSRAVWKNMQDGCTCFWVSGEFISLTF